MSKAQHRRFSETESPDSRLAALENQLQDVRALLNQRPQNVVEGQKDQLSLIVFSGSLDRLIAAMILATGAAASGMEVHLFFTFWGTAALRDATNKKVKKSLLERLFGWMLPRGPRNLPLSQMNMAGGGPMMIRHIMHKKGVASVEEMLEICAELEVNINICDMSMDLLGMKPEEMIDYPGLCYCGVAKFLETAAPGKLTMFV